MTNQVSSVEIADTGRRTAIRLGIWTAISMTVISLVAFATGIATTPISGPFCQSGCVTYPYANVASFVPHDYVWMYPGILMTPIFVILMACIHYYARDDKKIYSQIGLSFAIMCAALVTLDYFIQLSVIQPSLLKGETEGLALFSQYNPHGIFIAVEDLGYLAMSVAFLFVAGVFTGRGKLEGAIRWLFMAGSLVAIGAFVVLSSLYGKDLEYRFELAVITINWTALIVEGVLLSVFFMRAARQGSAGLTESTAR